MAEYIEKQAVMDKFAEVVAPSNHSDFQRAPTWNNAVDIIENIPPADVRPVVTCAECDWHVDCGYHFCNKWCQQCPDNADFYCAYGERPTAVPT